MIKKLARETSISMTSVDQDLSSELLPNSRSMNELGVTFLNTKNVGERQAIEKIFVGVLQNPDTDDSIKFIALAFLKHTDAIVLDSSKNIIVEFEKNPVNVNVVTAVKDCLAHF